MTNPVLCYLCSFPIEADQATGVTEEGTYHVTCPTARQIVDAMPGLKANDIRAIAQCATCKRPIGKGGPMFFRVRIEQLVVNVDAVERQMGLARYLGSEQLAEVLGTNPDFAKIIDRAHVGVCLDCAAHRIDIFAILEKL